MRYLVLATDYDGTVAHDGRVDAATLAGLDRLLASGRKLLLVTGRELPDLEANFPHLHLFAWVVAENGAMLYRPDTKAVTLLAKPPTQDFILSLRQRGVAPISVGHVIVATWHPHETAVLEVIRDMGLEMQVIFNKDAVMVLPSGVNKATGLTAALKEMGLTPHEVVGVGDAENDHAFLSVCECAAAVDNALPAVKDRSDVVLHRDHGAGVTELIDAVLADDLAKFEPKLMRHHLEIGADSEGKPVRVPPYGPNVLVAGPSGSGKSTVAASFLERLSEHRYRYCIVDPEGDYENFPHTVTVGTAQHGPTVDEAVQTLASAREAVVLNLIGLKLADRPPFFLSLLPRLLELRARTGRPHWLIVDEAHHLLPATWEPGALALPQDFNRTLFVTVHPDQLAPTALASVETVLAVGLKPEDTIGRFCAALRQKPPAVGATELAAGEVLYWSRAAGAPKWVKVVPSKAERRRHTRKYAEGELPPERSFYFRGPQGKLNLRAQNLMLFQQLADGVDDETWLFHLGQGDYSQWFRDRIKDPALADEAAAVERRPGLSASQSRELIKAAVQRYYTLPAGKGTGEPRA
ncbi:MAG: HAD-IIB family hydrolase [Gemmataceae bacterium]